MALSAPPAPGCPACRYRLDTHAVRCVRCGRSFHRPTVDMRGEVLLLTLVANWLAYRTFAFARGVLQDGGAWFELWHFDRADVWAFSAFQIAFFASLLAVGIVFERLITERRNAGVRDLRLRTVMHLAHTVVLSITLAVLLDLIWRTATSLF